MMIVVPAFAERQECEEPIVLARVGRLIADRAEKMRKRVDGKRVVPEQNGAEDKSPKKQRQATDQIHGNAQKRWRDEVIFVEPAQLREFRKIRDVVRPRVVVTIGNNPADVRPEKA